MKKRFEFFDGAKRTGTVELKNETESSADLYFYGDILSEKSEWYDYEEDRSPREIAEALKELPDNAELNVHINSGGGSVFGGITIANILKNHKGTKTAYIEGLCASIATVIALSCDKVVALKGSQFMIHKPWGGVIGNVHDLEKMIEVLNACEDSILDFYMDKAQDGVTREQLQSLMDSETWFSTGEVGKTFQIDVDTQSEMVALVKPSNLEQLKNVPCDAEFVDLLEVVDLDEEDTLDDQTAHDEVGTSEIEDATPADDEELNNLEMLIYM